MSYGGISGSLRAVEQLRLVFAELHAVTIRDCVSFANPWNRFDALGRLSDPENAERAMALMLARLRWWAAVLRDARAAASYSEVAAQARRSCGTPGFQGPSRTCIGRTAIVQTFTP